MSLNGEMKTVTVLPASPSHVLTASPLLVPPAGQQSWDSNPGTLKITWAERSSMHSVAWDGCLAASLGHW